MGFFYACGSFYFICQLLYFCHLIVTFCRFIRDSYDFVEAFCLIDHFENEARCDPRHYPRHSMV